MTLARGLAVFVFAFSAALPLRAATLRMEAAGAWSENISRSSAPSDWRDAYRYEARASLGAFREWRAGSIASIAADAGFEHVPRFTQTDAFTAGVGGELRQKFGLGAYAPSIAVSAGLHHRAARIDGNDGWTAASALRLSKRLTPSWRIAAIGDWQQHYARSSIFDTRHHRFSGTLAWDITPRLQLAHGNGRLWGDFTANAGPAVWARAISGALGSSVSDYYNTVAWGVTDSYGPNWVTYRVEGRISFWWLELSPALGPNTSLPLRYDSLFAVNKIGVKYRQDVWTLQLLHRF